MLLENLITRPSVIISFVGAGGKTSLIFSLAYELTDSGYRVLVTTTTSMFHPGNSGLNHTHTVVFGNKVLHYKEYASCIYNYGAIVAAYGYNKKNNKLIGYHPKYINVIRKLGFFDFILVEADGAKMKSIKCPASHEPVIPKETSIVVGCVGLDCIGRQISNRSVHRPNFLSKLCKNESKSSGIINQDTIITLAISKEGLFKGVNKDILKVVFLNKADNINLTKNGKEIAFSIRNNYPHISRVIVACLKDTQEPIKLIL